MIKEGASTEYIEKVTKLAREEMRSYKRTFNIKRTFKSDKKVYSRRTNKCFCYRLINIKYIFALKSIDIVFRFIYNLK